MANKITKRDYFNAIRNYVEANPSAVFSCEKFPNLSATQISEFVDNELSLLDKKNGAIKKPTEKQTQNEAYKTDIVSYLSSVAPAHKSIAEIWAGTASLTENAEMTGQRISALLTQLIKAGSVVRVEEKRKAYFKVA